MTLKILTAFAFDRQNANKRPIFSMRQSLFFDQHGHCQSERIWQGAGEQIVCKESVTWNNGLVSVSIDSSSINESSRATRNTHLPGHSLDTFLNSSITKHKPRSRNLTIPFEPVTQGKITNI